MVKFNELGIPRERPAAATQYALIHKGDVVQLSRKQFSVARPLHWIECGMDITTQHEYDSDTGEFREKPRPKGKDLDDKTAEANAIFTQKQQNGFEYDGLHWQCDTISRMEVVMAVYESGYNDDDIVWRSYENTSKVFTTSQFRDFAIAISKYYNNIRLEYISNKELINDGTA